MISLKQAIFKDVPPASDYAEIHEAVQQVLWELEQLDNRFQAALDEDLIEGCIYERLALLSRYRYLLRQAKACQQRERVVVPQMAAVPEVRPAKAEVT